MGKVLYYIFILSLVLIIVAYYKGASTVGNTGGTILDRTILYLTGRNGQGNFAAYPQG